MVKSDNRKLLILSGFVGIYHIALHFVGSEFISSSKLNLLLFVTPGMMLGYYFLKKFVEPIIHLGGK